MNAKPFSFENFDNRFKPLMHKFDKKYKVPGYDTDDVIQELRVSLLNAVKGYDSTKGATFMTYLYTVFDSKMKFLYRNVQGRKKDIPINRISYIHEENIIEPSVYDDVNTAEILVGLRKEAHELGNQILKGNTSKRSWLAAGLSKEDIEIGKKELIDALTTGAIPHVSKKGK